MEAPSLPGLGFVESPTEPRAIAPTKIPLQPGCEWRFEVAFGYAIKVKLLEGLAELFGTELAPLKTYTFSGAKAAIYTWQGCMLEVAAGDPILFMNGVAVVPPPPGPGLGGCQVEYTAEESPMQEYAEIHFALEEIRERAAVSPSMHGPRVLILGPKDAGKTSLTKILTAYATKCGRQPVIINTDPAEGMLSVPPGGISATSFRSMLDVEDGWGSSPISGPSTVPVKLPLVHFYGLPSPVDANGTLFKPLLTRMGFTIAGRFREDRSAREAGVIVDTSHVLAQGGEVANGIIDRIISELSISIILVHGSERMYSTMLRKYNARDASPAFSRTPQERISVLKVTKSGGCVDRDQAFMKSHREAQIRSYFFGRAVPSTAFSPSGTTISLSPHTQLIDFRSLAIYNITVDEDEDDYDPSAFLPGGSGAEDYDPSHQQDGGELDDAHSPASQKTSSSTSASAAPLSRIPPHLPIPKALENCLLAITNAHPTAPPHEIRDASIMGFAYVDEVDEKKHRLRMMLPVAGRVPARAMIWGRRWPAEIVGLLR